jgi:hypothetical protein
MEDNIRKDLTEIVWEVADWIHVTQDFMDFLSHTGATCPAQNTVLDLTALIMNITNYKKKVACVIIRFLNVNKRYKIKLSLYLNKCNAMMTYGIVEV